MNTRALLAEVQADLQKGRFVLYLEGKTDPEVFFALLGISKPASDIYDDVFVRGLENGSGGSAVRARGDTAANNGLALVARTGGAFGVVDGDGRAFATTSAEFDRPHPGPLFSWKAYCVENLLAKVTWPAAWRTAPDWSTVLAQYIPYAALNRVHVHFQNALQTLGFAGFRQPMHGRPLETEADVKGALAIDKHLLAEQDVESLFGAETDAIRAGIAASLDNGHAAINGKWLLRHYARTVTNTSEDQCRADWCNAVRAAGGLNEVRDLWQRITGNPP